MKKMRLLVTDKIDESGLKPLYKYFRIDIKRGIQKAELERIIKKYDCLITRSSTGASRELIAKATKLKIIGRAAIGVDNIDIFAATERKIAVLNAPKGNARVTAEHTIGLLFSLLRFIPQANFDLKNGIWGKQKYVGTRIYGKTLGIVGFGNVGSEVYRLAEAIGMKVVVCEPYISLPKKVTKMTYEELLAASDVVTFHVPLTYLTRSMINRQTVKLCRKGAYIINCSRGGVVEEEAIYEGLLNGQIAGFAVDVFNNEPKVDSKLLKLPNVIATPHIAGSTFESQKESVEEVANGIIQYIKGEVPSNLLNPQVFRKTVRKQKKFDFDAVIFDCDSTLTDIEGIDELGAMAGKRKEVAELTREAMEGKMLFENVYRRRLEIIKPNKKNLQEIGKMYITSLVEDAKQVIGGLQFLGKEVYIVSGSYTPSLSALGEVLGIPFGNIYGNDLVHDRKGNYQSFIGGPLLRNSGKLQIIRQIPGRKIAVGDSITDLETRECVDLFVGYGGVVRRQKVEEGSELYLYCRSLAPVLVMTAGIEGCMKLLPTKYKRIVGKGLDLLSHGDHVKVNKSLLPGMKAFKKLAYY